MKGLKVPMIMNTGYSVFAVFSGHRLVLMGIADLKRDKDGQISPVVVGKFDRR